MPSHAYLEFHRCPWCGLAQFPTVSGLCRRCRVPLLQRDRERPTSLSIGASALSQQSLPERIGVAVRSLRHERGFSQNALAKKTGTARSYLSRLEHGLVASTVSTLERLAAALDIDIAYLFLAARLPADGPRNPRASAPQAEARPISERNPGI